MKIPTIRKLQAAKMYKIPVDKEKQLQKKTMQKQKQMCASNAKALCQHTIRQCKAGICSAINWSKGIMPFTCPAIAGGGSNGNGDVGDSGGG